MQKHPLATFSPHNRKPLTITNGLGYHLPARQGLQPVMLSPHHSRAHHNTGKAAMEGGKDDQKPKL
jgi:hypothetical protein